ncbi:MAG: hypothetical protein RSE13_20440 [Planktothrix sp. GU0601_MAG3]|nr:MAG: hypothetical protein RSE13_20440 [Planktothrix sp. GU0601_MAG3]
MKTNQLTARLITLFVFSRLTLPAVAQIPVFPSGHPQDFRDKKPDSTLFVPPVSINNYPALTPNFSNPIPGNMSPMNIPIIPGNHISSPPNSNQMFLTNPIPQTAPPGVSNGNFVNLQGMGQTLNLQVPLTAIGENVSVNPLVLPELLTGSPFNSPANHVIINAQGQTVLSGASTSGLSAAPGSFPNSHPTILQLDPRLMPGNGAPGMPPMMAFPGVKPPNSQPKLDLPINEINNSLLTTNQNQLHDGNWGGIAGLEELRRDEFTKYLGKETVDFSLTNTDATSVLQRIYRETGNQAAVVYLMSRADYLDLVVLTQKGET